MRAISTFNAGNVSGETPVGKPRKKKMEGNALWLLFLQPFFPPFYWNCKWSFFRSHAVLWKLQSYSSALIIFLNLIDIRTNVQSCQQKISSINRPQAESVKWMCMLYGGQQVVWEGTFVVNSFTLCPQVFISETIELRSRAALQQCPESLAHAAPHL